MEFVYKTLNLQLEDDTTLLCLLPQELAIHVGDLAVAEHGRIFEFGRITGMAEPPGDPPKGMPVAVRRATLQDQSKARENAVLGHMAMKTARKKADELHLPLRLTQLRYCLDRAVLYITYTADDRVDCHELIKALSGELHVRVEVRQIGVRDAAKLAGGLGPCGRMLCCRSWLKDFDGVSVKMAKAQRMPLNPNTIGGMCGRLKCCLRYEYECYRRQGERLPKDGATVRCCEGVGRVIDKDILRQRLKLRLEDGRVLDFDANEVKPLGDDRTKEET
jgi:cell fate regulator YaaT (PSP1 superfamily)